MWGKRSVAAPKTSDDGVPDLARSAGSRRSKRLDRYRIASNYLFGDFLYAVLPLIVLAVVSFLASTSHRHFGESVGHFLMLKEWSFATIVLFGTSIRRFVRLKAEIQRDVSSYRLEMGLQLLIVLLIMAVLVLSLVILCEEGVITRQEPDYVLGLAQVAMFVISAVSLLLALRAEDKGLNWMELLQEDKSIVWILENIHRHLEPAEKHVRNVVAALDRYHAFESPKQHLPSTGGREQLRRWRVANRVLDGIEELVAEMRGLLKPFQPEEVENDARGRQGPQERGRA
jgi:hypothetical protein